MNSPTGVPQVGADADPAEAPVDCATDCLSYNLKGTLVLQAVTVKRDQPAQSGDLSSGDARRGT